ncbi:hypothetical protein KP509_27G051400 [Ceratopteris richardii]|uniref:Bulb-type lectin domain-containing protein n=1 Tax=Ceratopteris richardii TaxID=49495 RepID=A0A8T2RIT2_CERRI|nr:hypothetical protein KP509_27G051400 [Ceratopteris richardii]
MVLCIRIATTIALAVVIAASISARVHAANVLVQGYHLNPGSALVNGGYTFIMQNDCNLVLYKTTQALWSSRTYNMGTACIFTLQFDGNGVLYTGVGSSLCNSTAMVSCIRQLELRSTMVHITLFRSQMATW